MGDTSECWIVDEMLALILRVSQIIGVAPVRFNSMCGRVAFLSRFHFYIGIIITLIFDVTAIYTFYTNIKNELDNITLLQEINLLILFLTKTAVNLVPLNIFIVHNYTRMMDLFRLLTRINEIKSADSSHFRRNPKRWRSNFLKVLLPLASWTTLLISLCFAAEGMVFILINRILICNMWLYIEIQFTILVGIINSSFKELNGRLKDVLVQLEQCTSNPQKTTLARLVRQLSRKFVSICEVMVELNRIENPNLFFHLSILTVDLGINFNIFFGNIASGPYTEFYSNNAELIWVLFNIIRTLLLVESCHKTRQLITCTRILVGQMMVHVTSETIQLFEVVDTLFKQLILNDISYDVMGICIIDRHVISMVIGVATTLVALTIN